MLLMPLRGCDCDARDTDLLLPSDAVLLVT